MDMREIEYFKINTFSCFIYFKVVGIGLLVVICLIKLRRTVLSKSYLVWAVIARDVVSWVVGKEVDSIYMSWSIKWRAIWNILV